MECFDSPGYPSYTENMTTTEPPEMRAAPSGRYQ